MLMRVWGIYDTEYPEDGMVLVAATTANKAKAVGGKQLGYSPDELGRMGAKAMKSRKRPYRALARVEADAPRLLTAAEDWDVTGWGECRNCKQWKRIPEFGGECDDCEPRRRRGSPDPSSGSTTVSSGSC